MNLTLSTGRPQLHVFSKEEQEFKRSDLESFSLASTLNVAQHTPLQHSGLKLKQPQIIGHRGSPYKALENTSRSFLHAAQAGADGVELDVFLLKCGTLVVFHGSGGDENPGLLHHYCGVEGSILDYTAEEAKRFLTFNKNFDEFGCGPDAITHPEELSHYCYVHTLEEVLETIRDHQDVSPNFTVRIELKGPKTAAPVIELVRNLKMEHRCQYSSFDHSQIAEVRMMDAFANTGALYANHVPDDFVERCLEVGATEVHLKYDTCTYDRVQSAHLAGLNTMAWFRGPAGMAEDHLKKYFDVGNEDEAMYQTVLLSGVMSMCVNRPDIMVKALDGLLSMKNPLSRL